MNNFEKALLKHLTRSQLKKIQNKKIGIAGCGGLGSNIASILVRSGFKDLEIIDFDIIEMNNLNRQNYFLAEVGKPKAETTAKRLRKINPDISIKAINIKIDESNISQFFKDRDIIFEAFDKAELKKLFLEHFGNSGKLLIMGSGVGGTKNSSEIKIHKINKNTFIVGDRISGVNRKTPPLAPRVIACAALMASVALEEVLK